MPLMDCNSKFTGKIRIETDSEYMFHLHSSDGSKLYIDSNLVINKSSLFIQQVGTKPFGTFLRLLEAPFLNFAFVSR